MPNTYEEQMRRSTSVVCQCKIKYTAIRIGGREVYVADEPITALGALCPNCGLPHLIDLHANEKPGHL